MSEIAEMADIVIGFSAQTARRSREQSAMCSRPARRVPEIRHHLLGTEPIMAVLPECEDKTEALARAAIRVAAGHPVVFLYRRAMPRRLPGTRADVAHDEPGVQRTVVRVEHLADQLHAVHRYMSLSNADVPSMVAGLWRALRPRQTLVVAEDLDLLGGVQADRVYRSIDCAVSIMHFVKQW